MSDPAIATPPTSDPSLSDSRSRIPASLVGTWVSTGLGDAEFVQRFHAGGTYEQAGVILQQTSAGIRSFSHAERGRVVVRGRTLQLLPVWAHEQLRDPELPSANFDKDVEPELSSYRAVWSRDKLTLTSGDGEAITYRRQS